MVSALAEGHAPEKQCIELFVLHSSFPFFNLIETSKLKHSDLLLDKETR